MNLKSKVILITGASKGLGKALAVAFVREKAKVVISSRSRKELTHVAKEIGATLFVADVTKERGMEKLAQFAAKKFGRIDIWVNNAGATLPHTSIEGIDLKLARQVMEVNFFGTFNGSRAAMKVMKRQKRGTIVNIVSMSALVGRPRSSVYAATKWAARGFTESLRMALASYRIPVIAVHPGGIQTTIFKKFKPARFDDFMTPDYVAGKVIQNLKRAKPKFEIVVNKK